MKRAKASPGPSTYSATDSTIKMNRFGAITMGIGDRFGDYAQVQGNPGPSDYVTVYSHNNAVNKPTMNFKLSHGGIPCETPMQESKEGLVMRASNKFSR